MSTPILSRVRAILFPSEVSLSADFPWDRGVLRTFGVIFMALAATVVVPIVLVLGLMLLGGLVGIDGEVIKALFAQNQLLALMAVQLVLQVVGFGAAIAFLDSRFRGTTLNELTSLHLKNLNGSFMRAFLKGLLFCVVSFVLSGLVYKLLPVSELHDPAAEMGKTLGGNNLALLLFALSTVIVAPIVEEIVFRGFFFNMLRRAFRNRLSAGAGDFVAVLVSGAIFAAIHGTVTGFPALFISGVLLAEVYRRTGSLYASISMHLINNAFVTGLLVLSLAN